MEFAEKVFGHHPFVYFIDEKYYAFGKGICSEFDNGSVLLDSRYKRYLSALNENIDDDTAWKIFHKLVFEAEALRSLKGIEYDTAEAFGKFNFGNIQLTELEKQRKQYVDFYQKHNIIKHYKPQ